MGIEIIKGSQQDIDGDWDGDTKAIMTCSVTGWAFGPTFDSVEAADDFIWYVQTKLSDHDLRSLPLHVVGEFHDKWLQHRKELPYEDASFCKACQHEDSQAEFAKVTSLEGDDLCPKCGSDDVTQVEHIHL